MQHGSISVDPDFDTSAYRFAASAGHESPAVRERELWCAVIDQALLDIGMIDTGRYRGRTVNKDREQTALQWLLHGGREFVAICDLAGVSASTIRDAVQKFLAQKMARQRVA